MGTRALLTALLIGTYFCSTVIANKCLSYSPTVVSLTGTLRSQVFPGPPNFESIKKGDRKETAMILTLVESICTTANDPQGLDVPEPSIQEVQLVVMKHTHWKTIRRLMSKRVRVTGTLFHAHTGHHRTRVLIDVANIRAAA